MTTDTETRTEELADSITADTPEGEWLADKLRALGFDFEVEVEVADDA